MGEKEREQYIKTIVELKSYINKLIDIIEKSNDESHEGLIKTVQSMENISKSYNEKEKSVIKTLIISVVFSITFILTIIYIF